MDREIVTQDGKPGWNASWHSHNPDDTILPKPIKTFVLDETNIFISNSAPVDLSPRWTMHLRSKLRPRATDMKFQFGLSVAGRAKLYFDGKLVIDNWTRQRRGDSFFASGTVEEKCTVDVKAGVSHELFIEFNNVRGPADGDEDESLLPGGPGVRLGGTQLIDPDEEMANAVKIATDADIAIVVVGLNADWETESIDRTTLDLPGRTDELVEKVAKANSRTIVVTQSVCLDSVIPNKLTLIRVRPSRCLGSTRYRLWSMLGIWGTRREQRSPTYSSARSILLESSLSLSPVAWRMYPPMAISEATLGYVSFVS